MHTPRESKTHSHHRPYPKRIAAPGAAKTPRQQAWRPQTIGLSRDELRRIVLDQLG